MKNIILVLFLGLLMMLAPGCEVEDEVEEMVEINLYFGDPEAIESGQPGEYGYVIPVTREITDHAEVEDLLGAALEELIMGPAPDENVSAVVHDSLEVLNIEVDNGIALVDVGEEMFGEKWPGGSTAGIVFEQAVVFTAIQFDEVEKVMVTVEGEYWDDGHRIWGEPIGAPVDEEAAPLEIEEWIEYSRKLMLAQAREHEGVLYLLATYGERPTGGYHVEISDVREEAEQLEVTVKFTEPDEDEPVIQVITYPYDLEMVEPTDLPVKFIAEGDEGFVPMLHNLDWLPPLTAGEEDIRIMSPAPQDAVPREFKVEGIEHVFEGTVLYNFLDGTGEKIDSGIAYGGHGHHWGHFTLEFNVPEEVESGEQLQVEIYSESPKDGSVENLVELELVLE